MAGKKLSWVFQLLDKMSGPAGKISRVLEGVGDATEKSSENFESLQSRMESAFRLGERAIHLAEGVAEIGKSLAEAAIESASFKETTTLSVETILGSADKANGVLRETVRLASLLPTTTEETIGATSQLALAGFKTKDLSKLTIAASDVKALNPGRGEEAMTAFLRQLGDIQAVGLSDRHLLYLSQETHIGEDRIIANIKKLTGLKGDEKAIKKAISQGAIDRNTAMVAIIQSVADIQGGKVGTLSKKLSTTVPGLISTLKSRKLEFLMDLDESPAYASFRSFLSNVASLTETTSPFGKKAKANIDRTFNDIFGRLFGSFSGAGGAENLEKVFDKVLRGIDDVEAGLELAAAAAQGFLGGLFDGIDVQGDLFGPDGKLDPTKLDKLSARFSELGRGAGHNLQVIADALGGIAGWIEKLNSLGDNRFFQYMDKLGEYGIGPSALKGLATAPLRALDAGQQLYRSVMGTPVQLGHALAGGGTTVNVMVHAPGATKDDARAIAEHAGVETTKALDRAHARASMRP